MQATDVTEVLSLSDKKWSLVPGVGGKAHKGITLHFPGMQCCFMYNNIM